MESTTASKNRHPLTKPLLVFIPSFILTFLPILIPLPWVGTLLMLVAVAGMITGTVLAVKSVKLAKETVANVVSIFVSTIMGIFSLWYVVIFFAMLFRS